MNETPVIVFGEAIDDPFDPKNFEAENMRFGSTNSGGFDQEDIDTARRFYEDNFERYAVEGRYGLACLNYFVNAVFVPETEGELALAVLPPARAAKLLSLGSKARGLTGRPAQVALRQLASKAGLILQESKHIRVLDEYGRLVTTIPHSPSGRGTVIDIINKILATQGLHLP